MLIINNISQQLTEAKTVDATDSFQEEQTKEGKVVEGPPKVSTAEQTITDSPGEEEKEERNLNVTTISDKLKPELDPGEISPTIDNASQITKVKQQNSLFHFSLLYQLNITMLMLHKFLTSSKDLKLLMSAQVSRKRCQVKMRLLKGHPKFPLQRN